jgi:hypothetical protein
VFGQPRQGEVLCARGGERCALLANYSRVPHLGPRPTPAPTAPPIRNLSCSAMYGASEEKMCSQTLLCIVHWSTLLDHLPLFFPLAPLPLFPAEPCMTRATTAPP